MADPFDQRLKPLTKDKGVGGSDLCWVIHTEGDKNVYTDEKVKDPIYRSIIIIESLIWPGFVNLYKGDTLITIYIGNGLKRDQKKYYPIYPPIVLN